MNENVIEVTRSRLVSHRGKYREISRRSEVSYSWLIKFVHGKRGKRPSFEFMGRLTSTLDEMEGSARAAADGP